MAMAAAPPPVAVLLVPVRCWSLASSPQKRHLLPLPLPSSPPFSPFTPSSIPSRYLSLRRHLRHTRAQQDEPETPPPAAADIKGKDPPQGLIARSESALANLFGSRAWFAILGISLLAFAGGYIYLLVNFADFSGVPIFEVGKGP